MTELQAIFALVGTACFIAIFTGPWQKFCVDAARQLMFKKRDMLFDLARNGQLSFDSELYVVSRRTVENAIRFAHDLNLTSFVLLADPGTAPRSRYFEVLESHKASPVYKEVRDIVGDAHVTLVLMMVAKSPLGLILAPVCMALVAGITIEAMVSWLGRRKFLSGVTTQIAGEADVIGQPA